MVNATSIRDEQPRLEAVFGPITAEEDSEIRGILHEIDESLLALARHFRERAGWKGTGLDLLRYSSGQWCISSFVEPCLDGSRCVGFYVELHPAPLYGDRTSGRAWDIETVIRADCHHRVNHRAMDLVQHTEVRVTTPTDAATALRSAVDDLVRLAEQRPLEYWLQLASDGDEPDQRPP